jgi:hypothetical protein
MNQDIFQCGPMQTQYSAKASLRAQNSIIALKLHWRAQHSIIFRLRRMSEVNEDIDEQKTGPESKYRRNRTSKPGNDRIRYFWICA